jgi:hypothetical protein
MCRFSNQADVLLREVKLERIGKTLRRTEEEDAADAAAREAAGLPHKPQQNPKSCSKEEADAICVELREISGTRSNHQIW